MVFAEVLDLDGKTDDEVKAELQKLLVKRSAKKIMMVEARAEIILQQLEVCVEHDQLTHMCDRDPLPKVIWEMLAQVYRVCGLLRVPLAG
jgi:hypothetical protein